MGDQFTKLRISISAPNPDLIRTYLIVGARIHVEAIPVRTAHGCVIYSGHSQLPARVEAVRVAVVFEVLNNLVILT